MANANANKTTWQPGQSGNPAGRPPKCRALTDILATAGSKKIVGPDGKPIARKQLLAEMVWQAVTTGQVTFLGENRVPDPYFKARPHKTYDLRFSDWVELMRWVYGQIDGALSISIKDEGESDETPTGDVNNAPQLYLPDNGRDAQKEEVESDESDATE